MDTYSNIESLFSDYFTNDAEPVMRYASLQRSDTEENMEQQTPACNRVMAREGENGNKD